MLAPTPRGRTIDRAGGGSLKVKLEQGAFGGVDDKARVKREMGGWIWGNGGDDDDAPRRGHVRIFGFIIGDWAWALTLLQGIERADDEGLDFNEDVADDEENVPLGVDDEELERETKVRLMAPSLARLLTVSPKARLQEEFIRANATAGNLNREQTPESDDEMDPAVRERKQAEQRRERKLRRRLRRERKARGEAGSEDDDDDDDDDSLFGSVSCEEKASVSSLTMLQDDSSTEGEEDVKPVIEDIKPVIAPPPAPLSLGSPPRSRAASPATGRVGSARSVSPMASAGAGHHLVASRALSPQGKRPSSSSRKRKNDESQTAPPEAGRGSSVGASAVGALQSFKKSRPNTDAGDRRATATDAQHVPVASPMDVDVDVRPGTPVAGHPTGLPKHKARGKKKKPEEAGDATSRTGSPAVSAGRAASPTATNAPRPAARDTSPAGAPASPGHHPTYGPLTPQEYKEAIADAYDGKITESEFLQLFKGKDRMSVKEIRDHFGKRMKKNPRGILSAKFLSWKFCNSVDGGFALKKELQ